MVRHRGRWQAQGGRLEESKNWAQDNPLTAVDGLTLLQSLEASIGPEERAIRADALRKSKIWIDRVKAVGGVDAECIRSFTVRDDREGRRIDVEVKKREGLHPMSFDPGNSDRFPFRGFAENAELYELSREFWYSAYDEIVDEHPKVEADWRPWMDDILKDGNPILSLVNPRRGKGVILQQVEDTGDKAWFKCWMAKFGKSYAIGRSITYLAVETSVSLEARNYFRLMLDNWVVKGVKLGAMNSIIEEIRRETYGKIPDVG